MKRHCYWNCRTQYIHSWCKLWQGARLQATVINDFAAKILASLKEARELYNGDKQSEIL
jgi:hypothetical protein